MEDLDRSVGVLSYLAYRGYERIHATKVHTVEQGAEAFRLGTLRLRDWAKETDDANTHR